MSIREIPKAYMYECDVCTSTHLQENANSHYSNSTPPTWGTVALKEDGSPRIERLLCQTCFTTAKLALMHEGLVLE